MYYTSSGGGNSKTSGYSGQDDGHQYYGPGTGLPSTPGSTTDPSSRLMSGTGMSYAAGMAYGQRPQSAYASAGSWLNSSLESAQRSLQSWKSVGLSVGSAAASLGNERSSGMDPLANRSSVRLPGPDMSGSQPRGPAGRGMMQTRPRPPTGVQTFQPKGATHLRGGGPSAASGPPMSATATAGFRNSGPEYGQGQSQAAQRAVSPSQQPGYGRGMQGSVRGPAPLPPPPPPPGPPTSVQPTAATATASYRNSGQAGSDEYDLWQNQAGQRAAALAQQPGFGRDTPASVRGPAPRAANAARAPGPLSVQSTSTSATTSYGSSVEVGQGQNEAAQRAAAPAQQSGFGRGMPASLMSLTPRAPNAARAPGPPASVPSTSATAAAGYENSDEVSQGQNQAASAAQKPGFGRGAQASVRGPGPRMPQTGPEPRAANTPQTFRPKWLQSPPTAVTVVTTASPAAPRPAPLMSLTPFQARLQEFSTKTCGDLGISVKQQQDPKKHCSLEGFITKTEDARSSQKGEVNDESDSDDDDDDVDMTQCKLCNIKFEKEQVNAVFPLS